jgi:hypothetical protein
MDRFTGGCPCGDVRIVRRGSRTGGETRDHLGRCFCPRCGSSVFARSEDEIEVHLGSLDAPDQLKPTYESWIVRRESWLPPFPLERRYDRSRPS